MSKPIVISHAFRGFIYLPLFLAKHSGFFPRNVELRYSNGDQHAVEELFAQQAGVTPSSFAICDPLLVGGDLGALPGRREFGAPDPAVVVGSLIREVPVWLFNDRDFLKTVGREEELLGKVDTIRCYNPPNTGFAIGKRLQKSLSNSGIANLRTVEFEHEFDEAVGERELVITSNILKMAQYGFGNDRVVFSYASKPTEIKGMFFTGLLTRLSIFEQDLGLVVAVLHGLRKAVDQILTADLDELSSAIYQILQDPAVQSNEITFANEVDGRRIIKDALERVVRDEGLYSTNLEISREAWEKNILLRQSVDSRWSAPKYEAFTEEIPAILIQPGWRNHIAVARAAATTTTTPQTLVSNAVRDDSFGRLWAWLRRRQVSIPGLTGFFSFFITLAAASRAAALVKRAGDLDFGFLITLFAAGVMILGLWILMLAMLRSELRKEEERTKTLFGLWAGIASAMAGAAVFSLFGVQ
jgi:hypothetical protein